MRVSNGNVNVYAASLESGNNINVYNSSGTFNAASGSGNIIADITQVCSKYPNVVSVARYVKNESDLVNWDEYSLLT